VKETGEGAPSGRTLVEIADGLQLMGDFTKSCSELQERTPVDSVNPLRPIFDELWPFLNQLLSHFAHNDDIVEYTCRLVKHSQRAMGNQFLPFLTPFIQTAMQGYQINPIGSYVYAVEFCFTEFGHQPQNAELFVEAFDFIIKTTAQALNSRSDLEQQPDLVNDFFGMAMRYVRYNKAIFFRST
jgi:transportin-3